MFVCPGTVSAHRNQHDYKPYNPPRVIIDKLKTLLMLRQKLISSKTSMIVPVNELKSIDKQAGKEALRMVAVAIKAIEKNLLLIEKQIDQLINADKELGEKYKLVTSVPDIGKITFC